MKTIGIDTIPKLNAPAPVPKTDVFAVGNRKKILVSVMLILLAVAIGFAAHKGPAFVVLVPAFLVGLIIFLLCIINAEMGLYIIMGYSFFISHFNRLLFDDQLPIGVLSDILIGITLLGFLARKADLKTSINEFVKTPVIPILLMVYLYTAIEVFNPYGFSIKGAIPAFRKILASLALLFIAFSIFKTSNDIKRFLTVLFVFSLLVAIYACIQQWHGFFNFEMEWLRADPRRFRMTFVNGGGRKMSTMPDSVSLSVTMAICSVFFLTLASGIKKKALKYTLLTGSLFFLLATSYSLTRTANVMVVAGILLFLLITFDQKTTRILSFFSVLLFLGLMYAPIGNNQVGQFRQTFKGGTKDPSYQVRELNRKRIQPYIYTHPFGGGLNTTGDEAFEYHPNHPLAGFPPDSGYMKKALELGWIGFALILFLYFTVLKAGIRGYFSAISPTNKLILASATAAIFSQYIGDFAQSAIGQITDMVIYYPFIAIMITIRKAEFTL